jgi:hypothetical protein
VEVTEDIARKFAQIALGHVARPYPYKDDHVFESDADVRAPREAHPVFFGSYDWHSCVHGWWTLLTLRRLYPAIPEAAQIDALAEATFTVEKLAVELAYLDRPSARGFERPYGWGWLLYLHNEAARHEDREWGSRLEPLANAFASRMREYIAILTYPITVGTHFNTSFALTLAHEWAMHRDADLLHAIKEWGDSRFGHRSDYRGWEPGGDEFLSPILTICLLMSRIRGREDFSHWFEKVVLGTGYLDKHFEPVAVSDRSDGKIAHLDGLNLSRAWCLRRLSRKIAPHPRSQFLDTLAEQHLAAAMPHVAGDYMGEHWLASFALLALLER